LGRLQFKASSGKRVSENPSQQNKLGLVVCVYNTSYAVGIGRRIMVQAGWCNPRQKDWRCGSSGKVLS
jgi:hypothetical protein